MAAISLTILLLLSSLPSLLPSPAGINYGQVANNLPSPRTAASLISSLGIYRVKLYDVDPPTLQALSLHFDLTVGVPDRCVPKFAADPTDALTWAKLNLVPFLPDAKVSLVTVGNEVLTSNNTSLYPCLVPAMESLQSALKTLNLDHQIKISTPHSLAVVSNSYPPSSSQFDPKIAPYVVKTLDFLIENDSPFLINAYPYFAYKEEPEGVDLEYVLLEKTAKPVTDPGSGLEYTNMLHAQVDAVVVAVEKAVGKEKGRKVEVRVSETGWPSKGDNDEAGATERNAGKYNGNVMRLVEEKKGTPMRPEKQLEVYLFALFNENSKPGPTSERNYGVFRPDGSPVYDMGIERRFNKSGSGHGESGHDDGGGGLELPGGGGNGNSPNLDFYDYSGGRRMVGVVAVQLVSWFWLSWF